LAQGLLSVAGCSALHSTHCAYCVDSDHKFGQGVIFGTLRVIPWRDLSDANCKLRG